MSSTVTYKGNTLTTVNNQTRVLNTRGTWLEDDITIVDVTSPSVSGSAISVVDTTDSKGGTVRTITSVDISDTTAVASDVAQGKYFYTANGTKTAGTATGGGSVASWETLYDNSTTISSGDTNWATLVYNEPFSANETYRVTWGTNGTQYICQTAASPDSRVYDGYFIGNPSLTGQYTDTGEPFFIYRASATQLNIATNQSAGTLYIKIERQVSSSGATLITKTITTNGTYDADDDSADGFSSVTVNVPSANLTTKTVTTNGTYNASGDNADGYSSVTVNVSSSANLTTKTITTNGTYRASTDNVDGYSEITVNVSGGGSVPATQHVVHLEFTDETNTNVNVYYDDSSFSSIITSSKPTTYGQKTIESAQLDGVQWYIRETWETVYDDTPNANADTPYAYFWLSSLADVQIVAGTTWRITFDGVEYRCVATHTTLYGSTTSVFIGDIEHDESSWTGNVPFTFYNGGWGAWVGDTKAGAGEHSVKIERLVPQ